MSSVLPDESNFELTVGTLIQLLQRAPSDAVIYVTDYNSLKYRAVMDNEIVTEMDDDMEIGVFIAHVDPLCWGTPLIDQPERNRE